MLKTSQRIFGNNGEEKKQTGNSIWVVIWTEIL